MALAVLKLYRREVRERRVAIRPEVREDPDDVFDPGNPRLAPALLAWLRTAPSAPEICFVVAR
jgi:hypothetical protein